jgi:hypothetical protein
MAPIILGGPHGLPPRKSGTIAISRTKNTSPARRPPRRAAFQSRGEEVRADSAMAASAE